VVDAVSMEGVSAEEDLDVVSVVKGAKADGTRRRRHFFCTSGHFPSQANKFLLRGFSNDIDNFDYGIFLHTNLILFFFSLLLLVRNLVEQYRS